MNNYWVAKAEPFAEWEIRFPPVSSAGDVERLLHFAGAFLVAGEREAVYRLVESRGPDAYRTESGQSYADYLERRASQTGTMPFFDLGVGVAATEIGQLRTPGRVCYFDLQGRRQDKEVEDLGLLLRALRPGDVEAAHKFMYRVAPVTVTGRSVYVARALQGESTKPVRIVVSLRTDIWFPWVLGILEDLFPAPNEREMYENRALPAGHTPRLNRFLSEIRQLTTHLGGRWTLLETEGSAKNYGDMLDRTGILLDT